MVDQMQTDLLWQTASFKVEFIGKVYGPFALYVRHVQEILPWDIWSVVHKASGKRIADFRYYQKATEFCEHAVSMADWEAETMTSDYFVQNPVKLADLKALINELQAVEASP